MRGQRYTNDGRRQNIVSIVMLKNVKLSYGNVRFQLATPVTC